MKRALVLAAAAGALVLGTATGDAAPRIDYAGVALNVLPPGQTGELGVGRHSVDQIALYDGLTPLGGNVTQRDLTRYYKSARFGVEGKPERTTRPRAGLRSCATAGAFRTSTAARAPTSSSVPAGSRRRTAACCSSCSVLRDGSPRSTFRESTRSRSRSPVAASSRARRPSS